jgi:hypothetical protein
MRSTARAGIAAALLAAALASVPGAHAAVEWEAGAETNDLSAWSSRQAFDAGRITTPTTPAALTGVRSYRVEVRPGDRGFNVCANACERAQLNGPYLHREGDEDYTAFAVYVPAAYPATTAPGHWQTSLQWHGPPWTDSPPLETGISPDAATFAFRHNWWPGRNGRPGGEQTTETFHEVPIVKGTWMKFVVRTRWSPRDAEGFTELWFAPQGQPLQQQTFADGTQRETGATMLAGMAGGLQPKAANYRKAGTLPATQVHYDAIRVASTFAEAAAAFAEPSAVRASVLAAGLDAYPMLLLRPAPR